MSNEIDVISNVVSIKQTKVSSQSGYQAITIYLLPQHILWLNFWSSLQEDRPNSSETIQRMITKTIMYGHNEWRLSPSHKWIDSFAANSMPQQ